MIETKYCTVIQGPTINLFRVAYKPVEIVDHRPCCTCGQPAPQSEVVTEVVDRQLVESVRFAESATIDEWQSKYSPIELDRSYVRVRYYLTKNKNLYQIYKLDTTNYVKLLETTDWNEFTLFAEKYQPYLIFDTETKND